MQKSSNNIAARFCSQCGAALIVGGKFCTNCGHPTRVDQKAEAMGKAGQKECTKPKSTIPTKTPKKEYSPVDVFAKHKGITPEKAIEMIREGYYQGRIIDDQWYAATAEIESNSYNNTSGGMRTFDVYEHSTLGYEAVKRGFSWLAFIFTWIWAFIKKIWNYGLAFIGITLVLVVAENAFAQRGSQDGVLIMIILQLSVVVYFGLKGNDWRNANLKMRGYEHVGTLQAKTPDAAIASVVNNR